mmetsp:Transcript_9273/g.27800  ORF Transcript_9273/g.27800 Transcript_9273/m.27800 type:complete len:200 (+) Transcript_9273:160-759(+)
MKPTKSAYCGKRLCRIPSLCDCTWRNAEETSTCCTTSCKSRGVKPTLLDANIFWSAPAMQHAFRDQNCSHASSPKPMFVLDALSVVCGEVKTPSSGKLSKSMSVSIRWRRSSGSMDKDLFVVAMTYMIASLGNLCAPSIICRTSARKLADPTYTSISSKSKTALLRRSQYCKVRLMVDTPSGSTNVAAPGVTATHGIPR